MAFDLKALYAARAENRGIREGFFMLPEVADIAGELLG